MYTHPYIASQLAREHQQQMLAQASQRQLRRQASQQQSRRQPGQQATRTIAAAGTIIRRLATLIAKPDDMKRAQPGHTN